MKLIARLICLLRGHDLGSKIYNSKFLFDLNTFEFRRICKRCGKPERHPVASAKKDGDA